MTTISLTELPKDSEFEEFISAFYQIGNFYVERNIIERDVEAVLELDIIITDYDSCSPNIKFLEIKSGGWGFPDLFKIKGWSVYLNSLDAILVVQKSSPKLELYLEKAKLLDIELILVEKTSDAPKIFSSIIAPGHDELDIESWRFSYWIERNLIRRLKKQKKDNLDKLCYITLDQYLYSVSSGIFFTSNIVERLEKLYCDFQNYPHISAKVGHELVGEDFNGTHEKLPDKLFSETFFECQFTDIQVSTYVEHRARLAILKSAVDFSLYRKVGDKEKTESYWSILGTKVDKFDFLPKTFTAGLAEISEHPYFHKYPAFWQTFLWLFGGFILLDYQAQEYELLSSQTGIPVDHIQNALDVYNKLFPNATDWFTQVSTSNIRKLKMFSVPFMGVGANYRRMKYTESGKFEDLKLTGRHTLRDLQKWNNLAVDVLSSS